MLVPRNNVMDMNDVMFKNAFFWFFNFLIF